MAAQRIAPQCKRPDIPYSISPPSFHLADVIGLTGVIINPVLVVAGILGFVASFAISLGPVYWCLLSEIFPNRARGPAMALVGFLNAMSSFMVQFVFPWELSNLSNATIFFIYSAFGLLAFVLLAK
jgi:SP family arabinose:H+ symporter-like MFS transporter